MHGKKEHRVIDDRLASAAFGHMVLWVTDNGIGRSTNRMYYERNSILVSPMAVILVLTGICSPCLDYHDPRSVMSMYCRRCCLP